MNRRSPSSITFKFEELFVILSDDDESKDSSPLLLSPLGQTMSSVQPQLGVKIQRLRFSL